MTYREMAIDAGARGEEEIRQMAEMIEADDLLRCDRMAEERAGGRPSAPSVGTDQIIEIDEHGVVSVTGPEPAAELLALRLACEQARRELRRISNLHENGQHNEAETAVAAALAALPPAGLAELRELLAAVKVLPVFAVGKIKRIESARVAVLAALPFLAEPEP